MNQKLFSSFEDVVVKANVTYSPGYSEANRRMSIQIQMNCFVFPERHNALYIPSPSTSLMCTTGTTRAIRKLDSRYFCSRFHKFLFNRVVFFSSFPSMQFFKAVPISRKHLKRLNFRTPTTSSTARTVRRSPT